MNTIGFKVNGDLRPLNDKLIICNLEAGLHKQGTIYVASDNSNMNGIRPRWAQIYRVPEALKDVVEVGDWVYIKHGHWTLHFTFIDKNNNSYKLYFMDKTAIEEGLLIKQKEKPEVMKDFDLDVEL